MDTFTDKVALVTGGGTGIGRAVATQLAEAGAQVIIADISDSGQQCAQELVQAGYRARYAALDVSKGEQIAELIADIVRLDGRLDIAVNNAGIDPEVLPEASWDEAVMERILSVNLQGVFLCMKHEIGQMLEQGSGRIVNMASAAGLKGVANKPAYTASKHGVVGLTRAAALQYASRGIGINAVCPGAVDTPMLANNLGDNKNRDAVAANHPIGRLSGPEEIAAAVIWLCSDGASFVAGHALAVDGGLAVQ